MNGSGTDAAVFVSGCFDATGSNSQRFYMGQLLTLVVRPSLVQTSHMKNFARHGIATAQLSEPRNTVTRTHAYTDTQHAHTHKHTHK